MKNDFKVIGVDQFKLGRIKAWYLELCDQMNMMWAEIVEYLKFDNETPFDPELFRDLIKSKDKIEFLNKLFIEIHEISIPGISSAALAKSELLEVDKSPFIVKDIDGYIEHIKKFDSTQIGFVYPIAKLYSPGNDGFMLNEEFKTLSSLFCSNIAETPEQLDILKCFEQITKAMNHLCELGVMRPHNYPEFFHFAIDIDRSNKEKPFYISRKIFNWHDLKPFRSPIDFGGDVTEIFEPVQVQEL